MQQPANTNAVEKKNNAFMPEFRDSIDLARRIRMHAVRMCSKGKSSHIGSVLSVADILAVLYGNILNVKPDEPKWEGRDRFILSKGHSGAGVYAALAERGFFATEILDQHYQNGSILSGHVSHKGVPGVEFSTGSLGHGLSVGCGMALNSKLKNLSHRTFVLMSDGECDEGSNWEAILFAGHQKLSNLVAIVDYNKLQSLKSISDTLELEPFSEKWRNFGWDCVEIDGHDHSQLNEVLTKNNDYDSPKCVIAHTTKGKGVSFMENNVLWHYRSPQNEELSNALKELNGEIN